MVRKSPIKHHVRKYQKRNETRVKDYDRGKGKRQEKLANPRIKAKEDKKVINRYHATMEYLKGQKEKFKVTARSYPDAIEIALMSRVEITPPKRIIIKKMR